MNQVYRFVVIFLLCRSNSYVDRVVIDSLPHRKFRWWIRWGRSSVAYKRRGTFRWRWGICRYDWKWTRVINLYRYDRGRSMASSISTNNYIEARSYRGSMDLWDWSIIEQEKKLGKKKVKKIFRLMGRLAPNATQVHPSLRGSGGLIRTTPIREADHEFVKVSSGSIEASPVTYSIVSYIRSE